MYRLFLFLKAIHAVLLFIVLEIVAGYIFFKSSPYQRAVAINTSNQVIGDIHDKMTSVVDYFSLKSENKSLLEENARLREQLSGYREKDDTVEHPRNINDEYIVARVIKNATSGLNNYITINKGSRDGIEKEMALLNDDGIVGYILHCSDNFAVAISILNHKNFRTSGKILNSDNTGAISWDGKDYRKIQFKEVPKYAKVNTGDTIRTTQYSNIFPDNYPIGRIKTYELYNGLNYNIEVELFADMSKLRNVYAVKNPSQQERARLEKLVTEEE